ncbi:anti-sigma factor [Flavobacterium capsici]|uniref:Anti-sigma factor n=1 Tax=Flavobacterium capsici TaxID=3075618 RepID=A0AA96EZ04_9FLAO|nr:MULTISPECIES: anti-sigma factor [unclassified Flavobacterium]WNM18221.1 anti-sigma factor [Flavobacterium sp. PMR2A8]WNM22272.1 anti-sigma factor [Flavobacterium sp. PMTSA4]
MENKEYIESGILELYVYGLLSETENIEITAMAEKEPEIKNEILSIERAILNLSSSFSPFISNSQFEKIKAQLELKHSNVIQMQPKTSRYSYIGWAASIVLLLGVGYQYFQLNNTKEQIVVVEQEKKQLKDSVNVLELNNRYTKEVLAVVRDENNKIIPLGGQAVAPEAKARIYWNQKTDEVYVDASGLPEPPEGKVYQIWSLKLQPQLTPTSIGLLVDFKGNDSKVFAVDKTSGAEAFGITLEPSGGSASPTMEQLYTLGKV